MQILVLGMPHSGALQVARLLQMMGAKPLAGDLQDTVEEDMPAYLERTAVGRLHRRIFQATDTDWNRISGFDATRIPDDVLQTFNATASPPTPLLEPPCDC